MSSTNAIQLTLNKSAALIEGALLNLELENSADRAMAESWAQVLDLINEELSDVRPRRLNQRQDPSVATVAKHPWSRLHRQNSPGASTGGWPGHLTDVDPAASSSTVKIEDSPGDVEMADDNSNNNNTVSKGTGKDTATDVTEKTSVKEGKGKGKAGEVKDEKVVVEGKGKGKAKEVTESMGAKEGKGKGKAKEMTELVEDVTEETTVTEKPKNKGKSKGTKKARGRSQSTATNTFKSMERVPMGSDDEPTGPTPRGPSPTPSSATTQPWPTCLFCTKRGLVCGPGSGAACINCHRRKVGCSQTPAHRARGSTAAASSKWERSRSRAPTKGTASRPQSQAPPPLKKSRSSEMPQVAGPSRPRKEVFDGVVLPLPSRSFSRASIPPPRRTPQPEAGNPLQPASNEAVIARLQADTLTTVVEAMRQHMMTIGVPFPTVGDINLTVPVLGRPAEDGNNGGVNMPPPNITSSPPVASGPSVGPITTPAPSPIPLSSAPPVVVRQPLPAIPRSSATPSTLIPSPTVQLPLPAIPRRSAPPTITPPAPSLQLALPEIPHSSVPPILTPPAPSLQLPLPEIPRSSAPPIAVLSIPGTPSSGPQTLATPEVEPNPIAAPAAHRDFNSSVEPDELPSPVEPMDDIQATPDVNVIDVDGTSSMAVVDVGHGSRSPTSPITAIGPEEPSTPPALPVPVPAPSSEGRPTALLALSMTYGSQEEMDVDN
ncbi:hypothetical protein PAXINDRAFT_14759 [Paxillus involutus ATCC 200175]|uniref:Zn(2)-C6 fungal-type domain-containing protein n=1 Tax=Paxillus involutus ATCC 200175 TaxID=664439 RepID=A0A0C9T9X7_PAXIN|nr:hypothetical protein PAXINDRAFT_14759 [Paxillus involutus ATCC 200175]